MHFPLLEKLKQLERGVLVDPNRALELFLEDISDKKLSLYPAQEEAILGLFSGQNIILNTPTGSGKSLVAAALHFLSLSQKRRSYYTSPIKALVNEKFLALCRDFGPHNVGMVTGDASVNRNAPIICCTAEVLANIAAREGEKADVQDVIIDEFHYYSDRERGVSWQLPLLSLPQSQFLLMSATLGDTTFFEKTLTELNNRETQLIASTHRPVPLEYSYRETSLLETLSEYIDQQRAPIYLVHFTQRECAEQAQNLMSTDFSTKAEKVAIANEIHGFKFNSPYGKELQRFIKHGIGLHHGGLLPKYRILVESLAQKGLLKVICGTDTLGVGVNVPLRTVVFTKLCKFDGQKTGILTVRDFKQISGRAGRKGYDNIGYVVAQAPEHVVENIQLERKAAGDVKKLKKLVKRKPPEKGYVPWDKTTFERLIDSAPEKLVSRFQVSYGLLLNVLSRPSDGCNAMRMLIRKSHETEVTKQNLRKLSFKMFRSLVEKHIVEFENESSGSARKSLKVNVSLQEDFSLNHALAIYLVDAIKPIDPFTETFVFELLSYVEAIIEDPEPILQKQRDLQRDIKNAELKQAGVEFDERIAQLENVEYPKPNAEAIYASFNDFLKNHPWLAGDNISPKSIVREMYEMFMSFDEYIRHYGILRVEGMLLRYLSDVYKVLVQTVPAYLKTEAVYELESYLKGMIQSVDSSLLDEWERLKNPDAVAKIISANDSATAALQQADITLDKRAFIVLIRNSVFHLLKALDRQDVQSVLEIVQPQSKDGTIKWQHDTLTAAWTPFLAARERVTISQDIRRHIYCQIDPSIDGKTYQIRQTLLDPQDNNDWQLSATVDIRASAENARVIMHLDSIESI